ncbi:hypothetical protein COU74_03675 [Candidatus Peregrinibacteria bacterium CG10_big_fil_rev_8_21_14_0_10_36_19]|nr:MAG: hypothetical protein COU74_03675 [Candidatus Peregrinibacteria bacterium CG10_big_fil_rev_8_21_14_0_10_36_19]
MKLFFLQLVHHWKILLKDRAYVISFVVGLLVFFLGLSFVKAASAYKDSVIYEPVGDLLLNFLPTYNLEFLYSWGMYGIVLIIILYPFLFKQELAPFMFKTYGILLIVRSCFILLTDVGPPEGFYFDAGFGDNFIDEIMFRNDLFFSGHTSIPFLAFLLWKDTKFKWVMLFASITMGLTVLLMHVHYSIDVFAAFFITHGIYSLSDKIFNGLNVRFATRIKLYGFKAVKNRLKNIYEKSKYT